MTRPRLSGLYAITPDEPSIEALTEKVRHAIIGGARAVQYRNKAADPVTRLLQAEALVSLTRTQGVLFIVNDSVELALAVGADGVHLGKDDGGIESARTAIGDKLVGVSCYDDLGLARSAQRSGADYVAFGAAFPSPTKPDAVHAPIPLYRQAMRELSLPIVAIGGINADNARTLVAAGVDAIAVVSGLFDTDDITATAAYFSDLFRKARQ
jgi:thiamine-phosphate pyrophosphorylase